MTFQKRHILFALVGLGIAAANAPVLLSLFDYSRQSMSASHLIVIPLVSVVLVFQSRQQIFRFVGFAPILGGSLVGLGAALRLALEPANAASQDEQWLSLAVLSVVVMWAGSFVLCYGRPAARAALFPLFFLVFAVPIPDVLLDGAVQVLKSGSTEVVAVLFTLSQTPNYREGFVFTLPTVAIEVADECSGIRSSIALLLTSLLAAHTWLDASWKKWVFVLMVVPVTILKNAIRIVTLTLLAVHVDPGFLVGSLHHEGGIVFFLMALGLMTPVLAMLRRAGRSKPVFTVSQPA